MCAFVFLEWNVGRPQGRDGRRLLALCEAVVIQKPGEERRWEAHCHGGTRVCAVWHLLASSHPLLCTFQWITSHLKSSADHLSPWSLSAVPTQISRQDCVPTGIAGSFILVVQCLGYGSVGISNSLFSIILASLLAILKKNKHYLARMKLVCSLCLLAREVH